MNTKDTAKYRTDRILYNRHLNHNSLEKEFKIQCEKMGKQEKKNCSMAFSAMGSDSPDHH